MDLKFIEVNQMVNHKSFIYYFVFFISILIYVYILFVDILGRTDTEQLDEFDSEDESDKSEDLCKKRFSPL